MCQMVFDGTVNQMGPRRVDSEDAPGTFCLADHREGGCTSQSPRSRNALVGNRSAYGTVMRQKNNE
jgi:hypothetical protein